MKKLIVVLCVFVLILSGLLYYNSVNSLNEVKKIYINDENKIVLQLINDENTMCYIGNDLDNAKWVKSNNKECILNYNQDNYIFLKNKYNKIKKINNKKIVKLIDFEIYNKDVYLAIGGKEKIKYSYELLGQTKENIKYISDNINVATVDSDGNIIGKSTGITTIK